MLTRWLYAFIWGLLQMRQRISAGSLCICKGSKKKIYQLRSCPGVLQSAYNISKGKQKHSLQALENTNRRKRKAQRNKGRFASVANPTTVRLNRQCLCSKDDIRISYSGLLVSTSWNIPDGVTKSEF